MQQGFLQQLLLGRAMIHPQGLSSHPAFQKNGQSVIDTTRLFFDGNSQGGDHGRRAHRARAGLRPRRARRAGHELLDAAAAQRRLRRLRAADLPRLPARRSSASSGSRTIQLLWDRGEANGYAHHITSDPLPGTPAHKVLMHVAFGDHQVADFTTAIMARTIGARIRQPALAAGPLALLEPVVRAAGASRASPTTARRVVWWDAGHARAAAREHAQPRGRGPARRAAQRGGRARSRSPSS